MSRVLLVPGSLRQGSYNRALLTHLASYLPQEMTVDVLEPSTVSLPLFNEDIEQQPATIASVRPVHAQLCAAEAFIIASPEYNGQVTAYLKNTIDWVSRMPYLSPDFDNAFLDKPILLCSASTGYSGGAVGLSSARLLLSYVGANVLGGSICIAHAHEKFDGLDFNFSPETNEMVAFHVHRFLNSLRSPKGVA
jgi:NAD(P)H-dependent FMN reductase